jgi:hypothetical protein
MDRLPGFGELTLLEREFPRKQRTTIVSEEDRKSKIPGNRGSSPRRAISLSAARSFTAFKRESPQQEKVEINGILRRIEVRSFSEEPQDKSESEFSYFSLFFWMKNERKYL